MTQTYRPIPGQRADVRRPGHVYLYPTYCVDQQGMPTAEVEDGYVGKSARPCGARDDEHRRGKGGDPALVSPWSDLAVPGSPILLERGWFTDDELAALEQRHIERLRPRYNDRLNEARLDRIRKLEARRHRDARDAARGLLPRQWEPLRVDPVVPAAPRRVWPAVKRVLRSWWTWRALAWLASVVCAWRLAGWVAAEVAIGLPAGQHLLFAVLAGPVLYGSIRVWWSQTGRRRWRRFKRRWT